MNEQLAIAIPSCEWSRVGAVLAPALPIAEWKQIGKKLADIDDCLQFLIGDWLNYGEHEYGEKYSVACQDLGGDYGTYANYASVCSKIEISRRREKLSFSHHVEVAKLSSADQDKWLRLAEHNSWSVADLREKLRDNGAQFAGEDHGKPVKTFTGYITNAVRLINQQSDTLSLWSPDQRERTAELLRPIVDFYEKLKAKEVTV